MALADEFLADLENLEEEANKAEEEQEDDVEDEEIPVEEEMEVEQNLKIEDIRQIATLITSEHLQNILKKVEERVKVKSFHIVGAIEEDPEYQLIVESNNMTLQITNEITKVVKYIRDIYSKKFAELESLVVNPLDYTRTVKRIGNELDLTQVDLTDILPQATIMVVTVTATTSVGQKLTEEEMQKVNEACELVLQLDDIRKRIIEFVESRMAIVAPNLSALVGSSIAARLMGLAGGITALSKLPSSSVLSIGHTKKNLIGFSSATMRPGSGLITECELVTKAPQAVRQKAVRMVSGKVSLAARVDSFREEPSGAVGKNLREEIEHKLEKALEPPPLKAPKPLPAPDDRPRKKRGGKRIRRYKQRYEMTEMRKQANRIPFGLTAQETYGNTSKTLGMIGISGGGKVRLTAVDKGLVKKQKTGKSQGSSGATNGLSSSLAFTPVQGLELSNPDAELQKKQNAEKYFGLSTFAKVQRNQ